MDAIRTGLALMAAGFMGTTLALRAADWTTTDGKKYEDVKLIRLDSDSVTILYSDGGARIPLEKLPPNLQARFGYDSATAKAAAEARAKEAVDNAKALQAEMDEASAMHQPKAAEAAAPAPTDAATTASESAAAIEPTPVFSTGTYHFIDEVTASAGTSGSESASTSHHSMDDATQAAVAMRRDLNDPNYHTMAHLVYTVKSLGPDPNDKKHHSMDDVVNSSMGK